MTDDRNQQDGLARRERRVERRKEEILKAAASVFAAKGYAQATTKEIAAAADIAEGSLYNYFGSKRDILVAIISRSPPPVDRLLVEAEHLTDREGFIQLIERAVLEPAPEQPCMRTIIKEAWTDDELFRRYQARHIEELTSRFARVIGGGVEAGWLRSVDPDVTARAVIALLMAFMMPLLRHTGSSEDPGVRERAARVTADLLLYGLMKPKGTPDV
ncbi:MAG: TetR/AcrR family transcriptional regulator [Caldisericia bacterium]